MKEKLEEAMMKVLQEGSWADSLRSDREDQTTCVVVFYTDLLNDDDQYILFVTDYPVDKNPEDMIGKKIDGYEITEYIAETDFPYDANDYVNNYPEDEELLKPPVYVPYHKIQSILNESKTTGILEEDERGKSIDEEVEINGIPRTLYWEAEKQCFNAIKDKIKELEPNVINWNIDFLGGRQEVYVQFKSDDGEGQFQMKFKPDGKIKELETTYSNQKVTYDFIRLAQALYDLWN